MVRIEREVQKAETRIREAIKRESELSPLMRKSNYYFMLAGRVPFIDAIRDVSLRTLEEETSERAEKVIEMGSGTGFVYADILSERLRKIWHQIELYPQLVEYAKNQNSEARIQVGNAYDPPLDPESVDVWVGYSSYDSISFLEVALKRVYECLKPGGKFIHIQDVRPLPQTSQDYEKFNLGKRKIKVLRRFGFGKIKGIKRDGEIIDVNQDFIERLTEAVEAAGLSLVCNEIRLGHYLKKRDPAGEYAKLLTVLREGDREHEQETVRKLYYASALTRTMADRQTRQECLYFLRDRGRQECSEEPTYSMRKVVENFGRGEVDIMEPSYLRENRYAQQFVTVDVVVAQKNKLPFCHHF